MADKSPWVKLERGSFNTIANAFPAVCCRCLKPTQSKYRMLRTRMRQRYGPEFYVPFCSACQKALDRKRNIVGAIALTLIGVGFSLIWIFLHHTSPRIVALIALISFVAIATFVLNQWLVEPFQPLAGRIRFRNPEFTRMWRETWGKPVDFVLPQEWQLREED